MIKYYLLLKNCYYCSLLELFKNFNYSSNNTNIFSECSIYQCFYSKGDINLFKISLIGKIIT